MFLVLGFQVLPATMGSAQAASLEEGQVTVDGRYTVRQQLDRDLHMPGMTVSVSQRVTFTDLDFSRQADLDTLRDRIKTAARDSCLELERRFPPLSYASGGSLHECIRDARREGFTRAMTVLQMKAVAQRDATARLRTGLSVTQ